MRPPHAYVRPRRYCTRSQSLAVGQRQFLGWSKTVLRRNVGRPIVIKWLSAIHRRLVESICRRPSHAAPATPVPAPPPSPAHPARTTLPPHRRRPEPMSESRPVCRTGTARSHQASSESQPSKGDKNSANSSNIQATREKDEEDRGLQNHGLSSPHSTTYNAVSLYPARTLVEQIRKSSM